MAQSPQDKDLANLDEEGSDNQLIRQLLTVQGKEIELKRTEVLVRRDDLQNQKEIALRAIDATAKDQEQSRESFGTESSKRKVFNVVVLITVIVFVLLLVFQGETQIAKELVSLLGGAALGAFGGYGYAMRKVSLARNNPNS